MPYRKPVSTGQKENKTGGVPTMAKVKRLIKDAFNRELFDFYELETFEVSEILLEYIDDFPVTENGKPKLEFYGAVRGTFLMEKNQKVLPESGLGWVLPIDPRIKNYPLPGEQVVVGNYNGQSYYWNTLNVFNVVQENATPGISNLGMYKSSTGMNRAPLTKFKTYKRNSTIRQIKAVEGDLVLNGRFGNSINLGSNDNNSLIKIRSGQRTDLIPSKVHPAKSGLKAIYDLGGPIPEDINEDKNSIYLSTHGKHEVTNTGTYDDDLIGEDNCIIINSDRLIFNGRKGDVNVRASKDLYLEGEEVFINATKDGTIKMGDPRAIFVPTIRGDVLLKFQSDILTVLTDIQQVLVLLVVNPALFVAKAKMLLDKIIRLTEVITKQTFLNKQVMAADPDFKIPKTPKFPKIPKVPDIPSNLVPDLPSNVADVTKLKR
jgi:hypothetical protein